MAVGDVAKSEILQKEKVKYHKLHSLLVKICMVLVFVGDCNTSCSLCSRPVHFSVFTKKISMQALLFNSVDIGLELDFTFIFFKYTRL